MACFEHHLLLLSEYVVEQCLFAAAVKCNFFVFVFMV